MLTWAWEWLEWIQLKPVNSHTILGNPSIVHGSLLTPPPSCPRLLVKLPSKAMDKCHLSYRGIHKMCELFQILGIYLKLRVMIEKRISICFKPDKTSEAHKIRLPLRKSPLSLLSFPLYRKCRWLRLAISDNRKGTQSINTRVFWKSTPGIEFKSLNSLILFNPSKLGTNG
jgi:hypothetical protein